MRAGLLLLTGSALLLAVPSGAASIREGADAALARPALGGAAVLGTMMFYDPAADLAGGEGGLPYGPGDRDWVERGLAIYDLYRQLGGEKPDGRLRFRRDGDRYFLAVAAAPGRWFESDEAALSDLLRLLLSRSETVPDRYATVARAARPGAPLADMAAALDAVRDDGDAPVLLSPGETRTLAFDDADIAVGTKGLDVMSRVQKNGGIEAAVSATAGAEAGRETVLGFREGQRFRAVAEREVTVRDGTAEPSATQSGPTRVVAARVPLQDGTAATISARGETLRYALPVSEGGRIAVSSNGPSDVEAVLKRADGSVVARDDDGGAGYNFLLEADLQAGEYTLEVRHCCAGTGNFSLTVRRD